MNQDGASNGLTAPNGPSQQRVIREALANARLDPADIDAVEAHGTGTRLGDPIEAQAIIATYGQGRAADRPLRLGSLKSNIGHTQAAAGAGGVIKMVQAIQHGTLPRTLHIDEPTPHVDWSAGAVELLTEACPWPETGNPRRAGVSSFGVSGTNAHVIIEQAPAGEPSQAGTGGAGAAPGTDGLGTVTPWLLSARTETALRDQAARLLALAGEESPAGTGPSRWARDAAYSLAVTRSRFDHRAVLVAADGEVPRAGLEALAQGGPAPGLVQGSVRRHNDRTVFVFPGQGAQWAGMARELLDTEPVFARRIEECARALEPHTHWSLPAVLRQTPDAASLERVDVVQPVLFAVMVSLAELWQSWGVRPAAVVGHSQGEIAAACVAGALSLEDAAKVVALRSRAIRAIAGGGGMVSVSLTAEDTERLIRPWQGRITVAAVNGPDSVVVAGDAAALEEFTADCAGREVRARRIPVDYASHSPHVEQLRDTLPDLLADIEPRPSAIAFHSTVLGERIDTSLLDAEYWYTNLRQPVLFEQTVRSLAGPGTDTAAFVEVSPHPVLVMGIQGILDDADGDAITVGTLRRDQGGPDRFAASAAELYVHGVHVGWEHLFARDGVPARTVPLPTYPFEHRRYWLEPEQPDAGAGTGGHGTGHPLLGSSLSLAGGEELVFNSLVSAERQPWLGERRLFGSVVVPSSALVELVVRAGDEAGAGSVRELSLAEPLVLPDSGTWRLQVRVGAPAEAEDGVVRPVTVHGRPDGPEQPWILHAEGRLGPAGTTAAPAPDWPPSAPRLDGSPLDALARQGYGHGQAYRTVTAAWRREDERYAEIALPAEAGLDTSSFGIHPALLDAVLHPWQSDGELPRLEAEWRGVRLHATGATVLRVRLTPAGDDTDPAEGTESFSVEVWDAAGGPVLSADSVRLRPVTAAELAGARPPHDALFTTELMPVTTGAQAPQRLAVLGMDGGTSALHGPSYTDLGDLVKAVEEGAEYDAVLLGAPADPADDVAVDARASVDAVLDVVQKWFGHEALAATTLVVTTAGGLPGAAVQGFVRSVAAEQPGRLVHIEADSPLTPDEVASALGADEPDLVVRDGRILAPRLRPATRPDTTPSPWGADGTVLITGGTGTLGSAFARHLAARHGVRRLLLVSRRGPDAPGADDLRRELADLGAEVTLVAGDVADRRFLATLLSGIPAEHPLTAVVHAAGVIDGGLIADLTPQDTSAVLRPQADAAWHLHELTRELGHELTAFVLCSSADGILGWAGTGPATAAGAFADALAAHRHTLGLPATAVSFGLWAEETGRAAGIDETGRHRLAVRGYRLLERAEALALFDAAVAGPPSAVAAALDPATIRESGSVPPSLRALVGTPVRSAARTDRPEALAGRLAGLSEDERRAHVREIVLAEVAAVLGQGDPGRLKADVPFLTLGFDSLMSVELRNRLTAVTGRRLPASAVFDHPTAAALGEFVLAELVPEEPSAADSLLGELEHLEATLLTSAYAPGDRLVITTRLRTLLSKWSEAGDDGSGLAEQAEQLEDASTDELFAFIDDQLGRSGR
nr:type I polyketide synthase [Streptomyces sp. NRRL B-1140]